MNESICCFITSKSDNSTIKAVRFVYETQCLSLTQPFIHPIYVVHIVTSGTATMRMENDRYKLKRGDIFFGFPAYPYYLEDCHNFEYIYISFMGSGVTSLLSKSDVSPTKPYYSGYEHLCPMYESSIRRIDKTNSSMLTEAVLYYTLSFFTGTDAEDDMQKSSGCIFQTIVDYVDHHFRENDISLGRLADIFSYTEKYLSSLFKRNMKIGFASYLNRLRIQYANQLMQTGAMTISEIAISCGYRDYSYFSRVFKKYTGKTPLQSIKYMDKK